ncbi:MAG: METTL5 family protein [Halobacteriales archaeon]
MDKGELERRLSSLSGFASPRVELEQYPTPAWLAAHLIHLVDLQSDLAGRLVVDLGAGTGLLALAAATRRPRAVVGVERDPDALRVARENERALAPATPVHWVRTDATRPPLSDSSGATVLMNPPFGAQRGHEHADRAFLGAAADVAGVSYSIHNEGSRSFVESFAGDEGGDVTHAFAAKFELDRQFPFHDRDRQIVDVEVFRIEWSATRS